MSERGIRVEELSPLRLRDLLSELNLDLGEDLSLGLDCLSLLASVETEVAGLVVGLASIPPDPPSLPALERGEKIEAWCIVLLHLVSEDTHVAKTLLNGMIRRLRERDADYLWLDVPQSQMGFFLERQFEIFGVKDFGVKDFGVKDKVSDNPILRVGFNFGTRARLLSELE